MMELRALLEDRGIRRAVVIDDVYDVAPRPDELDEGDWTIFFDDLGEEDNLLLLKLYPRYEDELPDVLKLSQEFVNVLWDNREGLPSTAHGLFRDYESTNASERAILDVLVEKLEGFGLACTTMGRDFDVHATEADLIFVDLFLGFHQSEEDMDRAIRTVSRLVHERTEQPPLVVLMSRSPLLWEKRNDFRDNAGLLGSTFRVVGKADLSETGRLETLLTRLAEHYTDAKRVAAFVHAWDQGLELARKSFIQIIRRLDLSDLAQIRALLLIFEEQPLGEYLLDVADRVLQHEIESEGRTIGAAHELNKIDLDSYPAPHLAGSPDLQDLVHRMIFQHVERLRLSFNDKAPTVQYGDVLRCKNRDTGDLTDDVLLITTPACDLVRGDAHHVLVLPGTLRPLTPEHWSYGATTTRTPIFKPDSGSRRWIKWDLKGRHTIPLETILSGLQGGLVYDRLGRIREIYATEIQQRMLADMGRIGQPANPPATFPVSLSLYAVSPNERAVTLPVDGFATAVCFVGRDARGRRVDRLVLGETECDALKGMIHDYPTNDVCTAAQPSLQAMKTDRDFFGRFEKGLIRVPKDDGKWTEERGSANRVYLHTVRNKGIDDGAPVRGNHRNSPFVMKISDIVAPENK